MSDIKAVVFDWAGTMVDFGSFAPLTAFVEVFEQFGIAATQAQAREPMGMPKRDHVQAMLSMPEIRTQWQQRHGTRPDDVAVDQIYQAFVPLNERIVARHGTLIPGALETIAYLRQKGIKIGSTTGYTRSIMQHVLPIAAKQGYEPDNLVCSDDLAEGRPGPLGMYQCFIDLQVYPPSSVVKVDDTAPGIAEGVSAGCLTVGLSLSGNSAALRPEQLEGLNDAQRQKIRNDAGLQLREAGAHHVIDTVADLPQLLDSLDREAHRGQG